MKRLKMAWRAAAAAWGAERRGYARFFEELRAAGSRSPLWRMRAARLWRVVAVAAAAAAAAWREGR